MQLSAELVPDMPCGIITELASCGNVHGHYCLNKAQFTADMISV